MHSTLTRPGLQVTSSRNHLWATAVFLMIPLIWLAGGALMAAIDPDKLAGHANYVRNYRLLGLARGGVMLAMLGAAVVGSLFKNRGPPEVA